MLLPPHSRRVRVGYLMLAVFLLGSLSSNTYATNSLAPLSNVDNGGEVGYNQTICFGDTPTELINISDASGGNNNLAIEYLWMQSIPGINNQWQAIPGATSASYTPGPINQTTAFIRCARRFGFANYTAESNVIVINIQSAPIVSIIEAPFFGNSQEDLTFTAAYLPFVDYLWDFGDGNTASGRDVVHNYQYGNNYTVTLTLTDQMTGCSITIPVTDVIILGPLPVELAYFRAESPDNYRVEISWETSSEENNAYFLLQHSLDGERFEVISSQAGQGTTDANTAYQFTHPNPPGGINYYRLKQVDYDDSYAYSEVIAVKIDRDFPKAIRVYPNPVREQLRIQLKSASEREAVVSVFNQNHQLLDQFILPAGVKHFERTVSQYPSGHYVLKVRAREFRESLPFIKIED